MIQQFCKNWHIAWQLANQNEVVSWWVKGLVLMKISIFGNRLLPASAVETSHLCWWGGRSRDCASCEMSSRPKILSGSRDRWKVRTACSVNVTSGALFWPNKDVAASAEKGKRILIPLPSWHAVIYRASCIMLRWHTSLCCELGHELCLTTVPSLSSGRWKSTGRRWQLRRGAATDTWRLQSQSWESF